MLKKRPVFDYSGCGSCRICVQACPVSCLSMTREGIQGKYRNVFPELSSGFCSGCGLCAAACPSGCIKLEEYSLEG